MLSMDSKRAGLALVLGAAFATAACRKNDSGIADTALVAVDTAAAGVADTGLVAPAAGLNDASIVYVLDNASKLDSAAGSVAATKGTGSDVRDFGKRMERDHHALRKQGEDLAKRLKVTPEAPSNDDSQASYDKTMSMLNGAAKGKDFDKAYIDNEVAYHMAVLQTVVAAMHVVQNAELKNLIQKAAPSIQGHLDLAESIQAKMK